MKFKNAFPEKKKLWDAGEDMKDVLALGFSVLCS